MDAVLDDLVELIGPFTGSGENKMFSCPLHEDRTPSLSVNDEKQVFFCFSCGKKGTIRHLFHLLGKELDQDYVFQSLIKSVTREPKRTHNFAPLANSLRANLTRRDGRDHLAHYCASRPIDPSFADHFGVGFKLESTDEFGKRRYAALAFPYWDLQGRVTGLKYRSWNGHKYSEDDSEYGLYSVGDIVGKTHVFVSEGESDCHAAWSILGASEKIGCVGTSGASVDVPAWTRLGLNFIGAKRIYLAYDKDDAGDRCAADAVWVLGSDRARRVRPTKGKDISAHLLNGGTLEELDGLEEEDRKLFAAEARIGANRV